MVEFLSWAVGIVALPAIVAGALLLAARRKLYQLLSRYLPVVDEEEIQRRAEKEGVLVGRLQVPGYLLVWASDERMVKYDFCLEKDPPRRPELRLYRQESGFLFNVLSALFNLAGHHHYRAVDRLKFDDGSDARIFVVDCVYRLKDAVTVFCVALTAYWCGSGGAKYLGVLRIQDNKLTFLSSGPVDAYFVNDGASNQKILVAKATLRVEVAPGMRFSRYGLEDLLLIEDIDGDGAVELIMARMLWAEGDDCHWCPHRWLVSVSDWTPSGFRRSFVTPGSISVVSTKAYNPAHINGFIPGSISLFGTVAPANFFEVYRDLKMSRSIIKEVIDDPSAATSWERFIATDIAKIPALTLVEKADFNLDTWPTISGAS